MKIRRMFFSTWSVLGILAGRKTQTRRVMKSQPPEGATVWRAQHSVNGKPVSDQWIVLTETEGDWYAPEFWADAQRKTVKPRYKVGEVVAMGEAWGMHREVEGLDWRGVGIGWVHYRADYETENPVWPGKRWRHARFMPVRFARRWHRITDVRAERMLDISEEDALAEGLVPDPDDFCGSWQASDGDWYPTHTAAFAATIRHHNPKLAPDENPWLWAYTLEQVERPKGGDDG
jgi:hypothetical protein